MSRKMYWGLSILIVIFVAGGVFVFVKQQRELAELRQGVVEADKLLADHQKQQPKADNKPPRPAQEGFEWEWHGDHWHEVPIAQAEPPTPTVQPVQVKQPEKPAYTGPLTYHEELLKTDPVEALRLQTEERGHWSAEWIPTFEPGDQEAEAIARNRYLREYYKSIGDTDNPIYIKAGEELMSQTDAIHDHPSAKRRMDLLRLTWTIIPWEFRVTRVPPSKYALPLK